MSEKSEVALAGELEAIARAAADRLRAHTDGDPGHAVELGRTVGEAAGRVIVAGLSLAEIADAERIGQRRTRDQLDAEVLRRMERAARRKREAEGEHEQAVERAGRLGLAHRGVAAAAGVAHGTVRAILARSRAASAQRTTPTTTVAIGQAEPECSSSSASRSLGAGTEPDQVVADGS